MTFTDEDFQDIDSNQDDPIVITVEITNFVVMKTLVDEGSFVNILYWDTFLKLKFLEDEIQPYYEQIISFSGERVNMKGYINLNTRFRTKNLTQVINFWYLVI